MSPQETIRHGRHQATLHLPKEGHIANLIRSTRSFYEPKLLAAIQDLKLAGTYVDVGAHIGNHTVFFHECCRARRVMAIEPEEQNLVWLRKNAAGRGLVDVYDARLGACDEDEHCTRLDTLVGEATDVVLVKIDVGADAPKVLDGAERTLRELRPVVAVEAATPQLYEDVMVRLSRHGYAVCGCYNPTPTYLFRPVDVVVNVITYNRPLHLQRLLGDLAREPRHVSVRVYEDASTVDMGKSRRLADERGWPWHRFKTNHGKRGFWQVVSRVMQDARTYPAATMFAWLPDDVRLCDEFVTEALKVWNAVSSRKRAALNLQAERHRDRVPCWTGFEPRRINERVWQTQWVDGVMLCGHAALEAVDYHIPKPPDSRWRHPTISSGVWQHFSQTLHSKGLGIYRSHQSLVAHVRGPSVMHGALREKEPIRTTRFVGGEAKHLRLVVTEPIEASLASIPSRVDNLKRVVNSLVPQVDLVRVYLNGYDEVPKFLRRRERVACVLSKNHGDRGDAGKFFWCEHAKGYQLTCDDDLVYPPGYAALMIEAIERFGRKAVVGLHGICIDQPVSQSYYAERRLIHWRRQLRRDVPVHLLGTGVLAYHAATVELKRSDFEQPNMADVWMGLVCQKSRVPMVVVSHPGKWIEHLDSPWTIYGRQKGKDARQTRAVKRVKNWVYWLKEQKK